MSDGYSGYAIVWDNEDFGFDVCYSEDAIGINNSNTKLWPVEAKHIVYDLLTEWHFNCRNLPSHLWVDVNTLETNPYV